MTPDILKSAKDLQDKFNAFIKKWTGDSFPHLIDTDENDGEEFRWEIEEALLQARESGVKAERERCARIAETERFSRICQEHGHDEGEIKWTFNGCEEIAKAIREERKE